MPIYKIAIPERVVSAKTRVHLTSSSSPTWNDSSSDHGSSSGTLAFIELTEADREHERTVARKQEVTSHADHGQVVKTEELPKKETMIAKEIRLQMEREAELEAMHKALLHLTTTHAKESGHNHGNHHGDARHHGDVHQHGDAHHDGKIPHHGDGRQHHAGINHHGDNRAITVEGRGIDHVTHVYDQIGASGQHNWNTGSAGHGVKVAAPQHQHGGIESKGHGVKVAPDFSRRHANAAAVSSAKRPPEDNRLMKELQEQRRREEELREYWREIGMEVEKRDFDATDSVFLLTDDYEAPRSPHDRHHHHHHGNSVTVTKETHVLSDGDPQQRHSWTSQSNASPSPQDARRPSTPKVQPFEEFEKLHFENERPYTPHRESLMEREIKSVLMREDALRLTRGLGPLMIDDRQSKVEVAKPRPRSASIEEQLDLATSMKRYASSRLRKELEREKQREVDLLQLGKIRSLSEHRTGGEPLKYAEVATPDAVGDEPGTPRLRREVSRDHAPPQLNARFSAEMAYKDSHHHRYQKEVEEVRGHADQRSAPALMPSAKYPSPSVSRPSSHQAHNVGHGEDKDHHHTTRSAAEKRIELEVLEVKRRENELKELRKSILDLTAEKSHHDDGHVMGSTGATGHVHDEGRTLDHSQQDTSSARNRNSHDLRLSFNSDNYFRNSDRPGSPRSPRSP